MAKWRTIELVSNTPAIAAGRIAQRRLPDPRCVLPSWMPFRVPAGRGQSTPLPDLLYVAGPVLFQLGATVLLVQLAAARPRRLPVWSPALVFVGFVLIAVDLDLLPVGALLILFGLAPLARRPRIAPGPWTVASR